MSGQRDYPPAVRVHGPSCPDIKDMLLSRLPTLELAKQYPNAARHQRCLPLSAPVGVIEVVEYPEHRYEESSVRYPDATKALCSYCGGTHGVLDQLILPPGVARNLPSTRFR